MKPTTALVFGGLLGFGIALLVEWIGLNIMENLYDITYLMLWIYLLIGIFCMIAGIFTLLMTREKHALLGSFLFIFGLKLMNWALIWLIPVYDFEYGEWVPFFWW
jgi:hypothetical protein